MSFIKRNLWGIRFAVILIGAFGAMWVAGKNTNIPSPTATVTNTTNFTFADDEYIKGPSTAKVTLVEFGDFQCPACGQYYPIVEEVMKAHPDNLRVVFKHFPLTQIHYRAQIASQAAAAAGMQGKFWEMYDLLFKNQNSWVTKSGNTEFENYATQIGLDLSRFRTDISSQAAKDRVARDLKQGIDLGINGTPTFFLNGKHIDNPRSVEEFNKLIEEATKTAQ